MKQDATFGPTVRRLRESRGIGLRELCRAVGISATYLSQVERGELTPPAESKIRAIAEHLEADADLLMERAGRVPSDVETIIRANHHEIIALLRAIAALPYAEVAKLRRRAERLNKLSDVNR